MLYISKTSRVACVPSATPGISGFWEPKGHGNVGAHHLPGNLAPGSAVAALYDSFDTYTDSIPKGGLTMFNWTDEQRSRIDEAIEAEIENSRLAHKLIPKFTLSPTDRAVARDRFTYENGTITIDETYRNLDVLPEPPEPFFLTKLQTEDDDLIRARALVRRAAQRLARDEDEAVFRIAIANEIEDHEGDDGFHHVVPIPFPVYECVVFAVAAALVKLDDHGYRSAFVMIAGQGVYTALHTRGGAADLPVKAVQGLLEGGPVHRSTVLKSGHALILSISGEEIDRAVAEDPTLEFLRIGDNEDRHFRLYERFLTRFKQTYSAVLLESEKVKS